MSKKRASVFQFQPVEEQVNFEQRNEDEFKPADESAANPAVSID